MGKPLRTSEQQAGGRFLRARYDSAQTTVGNARHWAIADGLSANAAASPEVRRILRNRARDEVANNSYARGIVLILRPTMCLPIAGGNDRTSDIRLSLAH